MKYLHLVWAGLWRKPGRTVLTLLSVINAFALYAVLSGFLSMMDGAIEETRADVLIVQSRVSQIEPLPISQLQQIRGVPGVTAVTPMIIFHGTFRTQQQRVQAFGVDPDGFVAANPGAKIPPELIAALKRTRNGVLMPRNMAAAYGLKVGDTMPLRSMFWVNREDGTQTWPLKVVGVYDPEGADPIFSTASVVNFAYVDEGRTRQNNTTSIYLLRIADPDQAAMVGQAIDRLFANSPHETKTLSERQLAQDSMKQIGDLGFVVRGVVGAMFFALLFSVGSVMMQSMRERTPELAVLKTLGFTDTGVLALIMAEALTLCLAGAATGLGLATLLLPLAKSMLPIHIPVAALMLAGAGMAVGLALISGLPPAIRAMRLQVVDALAGR